MFFLNFINCPFCRNFVKMEVLFRITKSMSSLFFPRSSILLVRRIKGAGVLYYCCLMSPASAASYDPLIQRKYNFHNYFTNTKLTVFSFSQGSCCHPPLAVIYFSVVSVVSFGSLKLKNNCMIC